MGALSFPIQLFMLCVQTCHSSGLLSAQQVCGSQGQPTHTQPCYALLCSVPALIPSSAPAEPCQGREGRFQPSIFIGSSTSFTGWALLPTALLSLGFCMKPEGFSSTPLNDSSRLRPRDRAWELWTVSIGLSMWQTHNFFGSRAVFSRAWHQLQRGEQTLQIWGASLLQERKIFCYCYRSKWTLAVRMKLPNISWNIRIQLLQGKATRHLTG